MGVVPTLNQLASDESELVKRSVLFCFYHFAREPLCRLAVFNSRTSKVLIQLCKHDGRDVEGARVASMALKELTLDRDLLPVLMKEGIVSAASTLASLEHTVVQQNIVETITHMFHVDSLFSTLVEQGAVGILVRLCHSSSEETKEWCCFALNQIVRSALVPKAILERGVLPCVLDLCESKSVLCRRFCSSTLFLLSNNKEIDTSVAIPALVRLLQLESDANSKTDCACTLYNLADEDFNCDRMLTCGALEPVVKLTQSDHRETKLKCAAILSRLAKHDKYYADFVEANVLIELLKLSELDDLMTQRRVIIAVSYLSRDGALRNQLRQIDQSLEVIYSGFFCYHHCPSSSSPFFWSYAMREPDLILVPNCENLLSTRVSVSYLLIFGSSDRNLDFSNRQSALS
jgi:hypothetical protein